MKTFDNVGPVSAPSIKNLHLRDNLADPGTDVDLVTAGYQTQVPIVTWDPVPGASAYLVEVMLFTGSSCDPTVTSQHWVSETAANAWTPLGANRVSGQPYPDAMPISSDGSTELVAGNSYCVRVRARTDRDSNNQDIYGDFTYLDDGTGSAFTFTGYPPGGACSPSCSTGYLGARTTSSRS